MDSCTRNQSASGRNGRCCHARSRQTSSCQTTDNDSRKTSDGYRETEAFLNLFHQRLDRGEPVATEWIEQTLRAALLEGVISDDARKMARQDGRPPLDHALADGEDFELLVVGEDSLGQMGLALLPVGRIVRRP